MFKILALVAVIVSTGVLPAPPRPRAKRLSRGPVWTNFQKLKLDSESVAAARESAKSLRRVAVVPVVVSTDQPIDNSDIVAEVIRQGIGYGDRLIVVSQCRVDSDSVGDELIAETVDEMGNNGWDIVVFVHHEPGALQISITDANRATANLPKLKLKPTDSVVSVAVKSRSVVLAHLEAMPNGERKRQIGIEPQARIPAFKNYLEAKHRLDESVLQLKPELRFVAYEEAIKSLQNAITDSPSFLEAAILKASCEDELDREQDLKLTLTRAFQAIDPAIAQDAMSVAELKADYGRFVNREPETALLEYQRLLELNPTSLTGLWAMIDILLTGDGTSEMDKETLEMSADYAAKIVSLYPKSSVAKAIQQ